VKRFACAASLALYILVAGQLLPASAQIPRFLNTVSYSVPGASMPAVADMNCDGILDIVTANGFVFTGNGVSILLGNKNGTFQAAKTVVTGGNPSWILVADFNGDGKLDIAVANQPNPNFPLSPPTVGGPPHDSVSILLGNGDGTFQPSIDTLTFGALQIVAADFNGDGLLDLAVNTGESSPVQILLGNGDGTFMVTSAPVNALTGNIFAGDFNRDGKQDLLAGGFELLGNGDGTFTVGISIPAVNVIGDFNGDGVLDLAAQVSNGGGRNPFTFFGETYFGAADGTWNQNGIVSGFTTQGNLIAADFDGDGKLDIFGPGSLFPSPAGQLLGGLFLGSGDGNFTQAASGFGFLGFNSSGFPLPDTAAIGDFDRNGSQDAVIADGSGLLVALNTSGNPALLAQVTVNAGFVVGGTTSVTGTASLGGPAPAGGAVVTLSSSSAAATFPNGKTVTIPAGSQTATFRISTKAVSASTPVTITASYNSVKQQAKFTIVPAFSLSSVSVSPSSLIGLFGGAPAVGTVTLSGPASDGVVVSLASGTPAIVSVPASVSVTPGATTATFVISALEVAANTPVTVSATLLGTTRSATLTVLKETNSVTITKAEYTASKSSLNIEATCTDRVGTLQVFNAITGASVGSIPLTGGGKFSGQLLVTGSFTSVAVQSSLGGAAIGPVKQK
jgi:hypothetical protein